MSEMKKKQVNDGLPRVLPRLLLDWYDKNARALPWRKDIHPYRVWLSEIMLQQTGVEVVKAYYVRFLEAFPTVEALSAADEAQVLKLWEGLGYYSRARNLMKTAQLIVRDCGGRFPETYEALLKLPGIGPYTAGAIASICFNQAAPAVDGNVVRVIARIAGIAEDVTASVRNRINGLLKDIFPAERCGDFSQSLMELGAVVCIPNGAPKCSLCPAADVCAAYRDGTALKLPVKKQKQARRQENLTAFLLSCSGSVALRQREASGLLAGLWELPNVPGLLGEKEAVTLASEWGVKPRALIKAMRRSHVFTHVKWDMLCYVIECAGQPDCFTWVSREQLSETYALPTAFRKLVEAT
jgi:A/G-specific adenine glycosylase